MFGAEDYQALFNELGGEAAPADTGADANNSTATPADPVITTNPVDTNPNPGFVGDANPAQDPTGEDADDDEMGDVIPPNVNTGNTANNQTDDEDSQRQARAFAEMRSTINKYSKVFKQLQPMMGVNSEDEVIERLLDAGLNVQARNQNVDPAILKRMQTLEEQNLAMISEQRNKALVESFGLLQKDFNLTNKEVLDFAKELDNKQIDVYKLGVDLSTLYRGMHHDAIVKKQIEAEKQKWITSNNAANSAPGVNTSTGKKNNQGKTEINTMGELESLFNQINKK
jgi:hypothetical protein